MIVVCDSTILIGLVKIGKLDLLKDIFPKIFIPEEVFKEVVEKGKDKTGSKFIVMGLLGLFVLAKKLGLLKEIKSLIQELRRKKFRISDRIVTEALRKAGEG